VVNREFASKILGSVPDAVGRHFKLWDGTRVRVVGLVEDGKYKNLTEDQQPAMFFPLLQSPASWTWLVVRSKRDLTRDPEQLAAAIRSVLRDIDPGMVLAIRPWSTELGGTFFPSRMATISLGVLGMIGAMLSITGIFGMAAYSVSKRLKELGIRVALGARRKEVLKAGNWFGGWIGSRSACDEGAGVHCVSGHTARSSGAARRCSGYGGAGPAGYMDSGAARAFGQSSDPAARRLRQRGSVGTTRSYRL
jgi:hypothetical protein